MSEVYQNVVDHHKGDGNAALSAFVGYLVKGNLATDVEKVVANAIQTTNIPEESNELVEMAVTQAPNAKRALEKAIAARKDVVEETDDEEIKIGKECVRQGCHTTYQGPESMKNICVHHPGHPVFHETYKYWSCCSKVKKYCFDEFRALPGCRDGPETCAFTEAAAGIAKKAPCRHDFFQVGSTVTLNIYAKKVDPSRCQFLISPTQMCISIYFDLGKEFNLNLNLSGRVVPSECKVEIKEPKIEILLKKGTDTDVQGGAWETLGTPIAEESS